MFRLSLSCVVCAVCCQCFLDCPFGFLSRLFQFFWLWVYTKLDIYGFITESYHALRHKRQIDVYYVFITEPYHVLWYKGQIDVYCVFITESYHVLRYKRQIDVYYVFCDRCNSQRVISVNCFFSVVSLILVCPTCLWLCDYLLYFWYLSVSYNIRGYHLSIECLQFVFHNI